ncbi:MAG: hypothetical protein CMM35_09190 [Rhodospirillaceae bacterium]|nr:hypothetical protein [Rhodospirillaceae bacterium]
MTASSPQPKPCIDNNCRRQHEPAERMAMAAALCKKRGAQFTKLRRRILELLWENGRPMGAYELIDALTPDDSRRVGPPTVYRGLEFLTSQGLVAKIESRNAYVPLTHPERHLDCLFFICIKCGKSDQFEDQRLESLISEGAARIGFHTQRRVVEVEGTCSNCAFGSTT